MKEQSCSIAFRYSLFLLFGGKKLPELMRGAGRGIREFKDAVNTATAPEEDKKPEAKAEPKKEE